MDAITVEIQRASCLILDRATRELAERQHLFLISDETPDDWDTAFKLPGWNLERRKMKKRVTYGHPRYDDLNDENIIGIGEEFIENGLYSILTLEDQETNPKAERIHKKLMNGSLTDASIRCRATDGRMGKEELGENPKIFYYTQQELVDWGVVMEGSNFAAMKERTAQIEQFIKERVPSKYHDHISYLKALKTRYYIF